MLVMVFLDVLQKNHIYAIWQTLSLTASIVWTDLVHLLVFEGFQNLQYSKLEETMNHVPINIVIISFEI